MRCVRSLTLSTKSQSWLPSYSLRRPPSSTANERRTHDTWQVNMMLIMVSGDQSGLKNGSRKPPSTSSLSSSLYR